MSLFITFEGPEGAGKTTVMNEIVNRLINKGKSVVHTREPGGIRISEAIRKVILENTFTEMDKKTEALLYAAARRQHLVEKILPALTENKMVLCDRFIDSSLAYQGYARGIGINEVMQINQFAIDHKMPDLTIFFDVPPTIGLERIHSNITREINRLDQETIEFHQKVYTGYQILIDKYPERIITVDATQQISNVIDTVWQIIERYLNEK